MMMGMSSKTVSGKCHMPNSPPGVSGYIAAGEYCLKARAMP